MLGQDLRVEREPLLELLDCRLWAKNCETIDETMHILPQAAPANVAQPYETALARSMCRAAGIDPRPMEICYIRGEIVA